MKYLLLVTWDADQMNRQPEPEPATPETEEESFPWLDELRARNAWVIGEQLASPRRARSFLVREGMKHITDGPFTETKEAIGGFDLIEADSLDEAVEIASRHPVAAIGAIEIRPLMGG